MPRPSLRSLLLLSLAACPSAPPAPPVPASAPPSTAASSQPPPAVPLPVAPAPVPVPEPEPAPIDPVPILFPGGTASARAAGCLARQGGRERTRCLLAARYEGDPEATRIATTLFERTGSVAGVQVEQVMDGGFRGKIHLIPEAPVGRFRGHLAWVEEAMEDFDAFFSRLAAPALVHYRVRPLAFRFFRSVERTTPSAYAEGWEVSYNVSGSLHRSANAVRETLFHEIFHLNDADHGDWSHQHLTPIFAAIVARCGTRTACLAPYAPGDTMVRGGTYYAFQPDNGESVHEYAAELALRWYREQRALQRGERMDRAPFRCGPDENRRAWEAMVEEFFGGASTAIRCGPATR